MFMSADPEQQVNGLAWTQTKSLAVTVMPEVERGI